MCEFKKGDIKMSSSEYTRVLEAARHHFNNGDLEGYVTTLYAPDCTFHYFPPEIPGGREGARIYYGAFLSGFPDAQLNMLDILLSGDKVAVRYQLTLTHLGEFNGIPATGKTAVLKGITIMRFANDKVVERWNETDFLGLLQQLGVMPQAEAS
jgi:hypothetical protein